MPKILLENIEKRFGKVLASQIPHLEIEPGEFFTLLGPSGCGKTTTLRMIAGLLKPDKGRIYLDSKDITDLPPEKRNITMVFQNFALFPHLNVYENIAFGLKMRKMSREEIDKRVLAAAQLLRLENLLDRKIDQLSGGQQQRVGVARAIAPQPDVILFDEPLSNLDAKLREEIRFELRELQKSLGITSIYVTHDQAEAMVMSDRILVMNAGQMVQIGKPEEIYQRPKNTFTANFIGIANVLPCTIEDVQNESVIVKLPDGTVLEAKGEELKKGENAFLICRPEAIKVLTEEDTTTRNTLSAVVKRAVYLGNEIEYRMEIAERELRVKTPPTARFHKVSEKVRLLLLKDLLWVVRE